MVPEINRRLYLYLELTLNVASEVVAFPMGNELFRRIDGGYAFNRVIAYFMCLIIINYCVDNGLFASATWSL